MLLSCNRLNGRPGPGCAGFLHLHLQAANTHSKHVVPKAQFWTAHRPQRNLRGAQRRVRIAAGKANDIAYGVLASGIGRIRTGKVVGEGNRVNDPAIAGGRTSRPAVRPTTGTRQGPGRLRGHLVLIEVFKPRQFGHSAQGTRGVIGSPTAHGTVRATISNIKIIARRRLQSVRSERRRGHPGRTLPIAQREPQRAVFNLVEGAGSRVTNGDTIGGAGGERY